VKREAIGSAAKAATMLLRIADVIAACWARRSLPNSQYRNIHDLMRISL